MSFDRKILELQIINLEKRIELKHLLNQFDEISALEIQKTELETLLNGLEPEFMEKTITLASSECRVLKVAISILLEQDKQFIDCYGNATDCSSHVSRVKDLQSILDKIV